MNVRAIRTRLFHEKEPLVQFIVEHVSRIKEGSIVVVTSKIVALAEGRVTDIASDKEKTRIIRSESEFAIKTKHAWLTIKDGVVLPSAGVDESNAQGRLILLPKDSFTQAARIRRALKKHYRLKRLGVIITDSRVLPLRAGVVGVALGYAGFHGVKDYRGKQDLFDRPLKITRVDVADSLATAAVFEMGEGAERRPLAVIQDVEVEFCERINRNELKIKLTDDLFKPLFARLKGLL
jgi:coenzyme F420-0:L-glutamate ligase